MDEAQTFLNDFQKQENDVERLVVKDFDINQIHQQIKLLNSKYLNSCSIRNMSAQPKESTELVHQSEIFMTR